MIALVFPGQGSQQPGMGAELLTTAEGQKVAAAIQKACGVDIRALTQNLDDETLRQTQNAQMALYSVGTIAGLCLLAKGVTDVRYAAGHSIGEYAALAVTGAVSVEDGAKLVRRRGELMAGVGRDRKGAMSAVLGLERAALDAVCEKASHDSAVAVVANDNCPGQLVISGDAAAVVEAGELAKAAGAKRVLPLNVSGAFHSPLMEDAAQSMGRALCEAAFQKGTFWVVSNVTAEPVEDSGGWPNLLEGQLRNPVRWAESVRRMIELGVDTFVECGHGEVLSGLIRRTDGSVRTLQVKDLASLEATAQTLMGVTA